ncbi:hypothetical protein AAFL35_07875 [Proteus mirabilis]|uniref:hypothetical protein n=1 Tax=Proteus mirabilis TaxID=584 RepID=UPI001B9001B8|nr:hypothetical protein [Proteus mirabilis]MDM3838036.1 hypothetical protein [Proteus mirabilis]HBC6051794.1 hypothetical protein [Proteus mirabilis]HEK3114874.1 hypothetical protein [Proteus mirabilis]
MDDVQRHFLNLTKEQEMMAIALDHGLSAMRDVAKDTLNTIGDASNRILRLGYSYVFDEQEFNTILDEDKRLTMAIWQFTENKNPLQDVIQTYLDLTLRNKTEKEVSDIYSIIEKSIGFGAKYSTKKLTKMVMIEILCQVLYKSIIYSPVVLKRVKTLSNVLLAVGGIYGRSEQAAFAAQQLKIVYPEYYYALYNKGIEMLYFIPKPKMDKGIYVVDGYSSSSDIMNAILDMLV